MSLLVTSTLEPTYRVAEKNGIWRSLLEDFAQLDIVMANEGNVKEGGLACLLTSPM